MDFNLELSTKLVKLFMHEASLHIIHSNGFMNPVYLTPHLNLMYKVLLFSVKVDPNVLKQLFDSNNTVQFCTNKV